MLEPSREIWLFPKNNCRNLATGKPNKNTHTHTHTQILLAILKFFFQPTGKFSQEKKHKKKKKKKKALLLHHQHHDHDHHVSC
jgi:hypothetical protein